MPVPDDLFKRFPEIMAILSAAELKDPKVTPEKSPSQAVRDAFRDGMIILSSLAPGDIDPWNRVEIRQIIRKSTRYIVFVDDRLEVRWWWLLMPQNTQLLGIVQARIAQLVHDSSFLLTTTDSSLLGIRVDKKPYSVSAIDHHEARNIRALIGESLALVLNGGTVEQCEKVLAEAKQLIEVAKDRVSRPVFIWGFILAVVIISLLTAAWHCWGEFCSDGNNHEFVLSWLEAATAGAFGAMISAMTRTRQLALEPAAGTVGLYVEAGARAVIGAGAGMLMGFAFDSGLVGKGALQSHAWETARLFLCLAAGASERILPALIAKAESMTTATSTTTTTTTITPPPGPQQQGQQAQGQAGQPQQTTPRPPDSPDVLPD